MECISTSDTASRTCSTNETHTQQPQATGLTPPKPEEKGPPTLAEERHTIDVTPTPPAPPNISDAADYASDPTSEHQQDAVSKKLSLRNQQEDVSCTEETVEREPAKQGLPEPDFAEKIRASDPPMAPTVPFDPKDGVLDDGVANDATSHSAAQPQTTTEAEVEYRTDTVTSDQGISIAAENTSTANKKASTPSVTSIEKPASETIVLLEDTPVKGVCERPTSETKATIISPADPQLSEISMASKNDLSPPKTDPAMVELSKKSGAQHTESLHPFSKPAKALAKKEKEQKKKAQKREREQAEKAKATRIAASKATPRTATAENNGAIKTKDGPESSTVSDSSKPAVYYEADGKVAPSSSDKVQSASVTGATTASASAQTSTSPVVAHKAVDDNRDKPGKRKGKKKNAPAAPAADKTNEDDGKQPGGTVSIPNEFPSVTNKDLKAIPQKDAQDLDAQSSEQLHADEAHCATKESVLGVRFAEVSTPTTKKKSKTKKKKKAPTWPDLEFRPKSPNPSWMGPIDMATDVQNYEEIMNRACDGEDDSDFSWSDLPRVEDEMSYDEGDFDEGDDCEDSGQDLDAINKRIAELQNQRGNTQSIAPLHHLTLTDTTKAGPSHSVSSNSRTEQITNAPQTDIVNRAISAIEAKIGKSTYI
ncbi:hypothetical protein C7974DRAFT_37655 [Boeremia exigua]|uniref:uncharacterized protein n=1 Tax=Boeremia exigua TaxID=749465 RepID=UPI001E8D55F8|nr:uncharacterized protein C7974DRAFT_37655 [Boeremia exigua]KAH6618803.1 hypothetical protein C7974DRAFT_37655 [Boeremia exigua]